MTLVILGVALASVLYRLLNGAGLEQSGLLFIGIPTAMAVLLTNAPAPRSATGMLMMAVTYLLLLSGILLIEGIVCILFAAPLFYGCALILGLIGDLTNKWLNRRSGGRVNCCVAIVFLAMSLEGVHEALSFSREREVSGEFYSNLPAAEVAQRLAARPEFDVAARPAFFKLGFPQPVSAAGRGIALGDRRTIRFAGGEGEPGDLELEVVASEPGRVAFACVSDTSHIAHWLDWREVEVHWGANLADGSGTRLVWSVRYRRLLDPAWYFAPMQDFAMRRVIEYLSSTLLGEAGE